MKTDYDLSIPPESKFQTLAADPKINRDFAL